jgi:hypothetical protein
MSGPRNVQELLGVQGHGGSWGLGKKLNSNVGAQGPVEKSQEGFQRPRGPFPPALLKHCWASFSIIVAFPLIPWNCLKPPFIGEWPAEGPTPLAIGFDRRGGVGGEVPIIGSYCLSMCTESSPRWFPLSFPRPYDDLGGALGPRATGSLFLQPSGSSGLRQQWQWENNIQSNNMLLRGTLIEIRRRQGRRQCQYFRPQLLQRQII